MSNVKVYSNLVQAHGGVLQGVGPLGVPATTIVSTNGIPCRGAKNVVVRVVGTDANAWVNFNTWVSNQASRLPATPGWITPPAGYLSRVAGLTQANGAGGASVIIEAVNGAFFHDFVQFWGTAHATLAHTAVQLSAEVWYSSDADEWMRVNGQNGVVPLLT